MVDQSMEAIGTDDLSGQFSEVAAIAGITAARALVKAYAGRTWAVPQKPTRALEGEVGEAAAARLCAEMGGLRVLIPSEASIAKILRRREIIELTAQGVTTREIARRVGLTERAVWYVRKGDDNE